jgi:putative two-component system response regulator
MDASKNFLVIIVDDDTVFTAILETFLTQKNIKVLVCNDPHEGLRKAKELSPGLILLDIDMPDMTGGEFATTIQTNSDTQSIPIIFLTQLVDGKSGSQNVVVKGQNFLAIGKPFDERTVLIEIAKVMKARSGS